MKPRREKAIKENIAFLDSQLCFEREKMNTYHTQEWRMKKYGEEIKALRIEPLLAEAVETMETFRLLFDMAEGIPQIIDFESLIAQIDGYLKKVETS